MIYSGIDEAGLGPILGPYCATAVTMSSPSPLKELMEDQQKRIFYIDDSKKVYQGKGGLLRLEQNVLSFYYLLNGSIPKNTSEFIPSLNSPWNKKYNLSLPLLAKEKDIVDKSTSILKIFKQRGVKMLDIKRTAVSPSNFNHLIDLYDNKSSVCQKIIEPLISTAIIKGREQVITIDKQGGRKFYKPYLDEITGFQFTIIKEEANHSHYKWDTNHIHFKAKADSTDFTTALASMFSKYMREISMKSFNDYWDNIIPGIKRTAGYYTDGLRFLEELKNRDKMPSNKDLIQRKK
ncbi:hypothetical protein EW093_11080 [Thiospirochaeta perfilievii]|uniref:Uncharacterized protein n=1 Tax=Thiospirochaeta perfilievii TaxID=252967 RepID=A0A5C1QCG0_9SPIO|nr:hypothetical protein [Thiospirochaeta perfilievii]QEN05231.1 hypothetical protein EW093_11080 [Thiospirochaeta perfilievii]